MKKTWMKVAFVVALAAFLIAASIDIKNSGVMVTNGYIVAPVRGPNGAAATPTFGFSGDAGNGMYLSAADTLGFSAGGTGSLTVSTTAVTSALPVDLGTNDLTCNQGTYTVDAITALTAPSTTTAVASDGILLRNTTAAATAQEFSPSLRLDGVGYTAGPTNTRQSWVITNKPTSATAGMIAFDFASAGGDYAVTSPATISDTGTINLANALIAAGGVAAQSQYIYMDRTTILGALQYGIGSYNNPIVIGAGTPNGTTAIGVKVGTEILMTAEGSRLGTYQNTTIIKSSIDKDGVDHQAYASGQVTDAEPSLALTLVTAMDDDTIYDVTVGCQYIGYAAGAVGTPTYHFSSVIGASFIRIDGVASEVGANTTISHKEDASAACVPCAVSFTNGATDTITATFTQCHLDADVANVKAWVKSMTKTNITTFTGVNQPAAN